jgi:hypothetical protein
MYEWDTDAYLAAMEATYEAIRRRHPDLVTRRFECWAGWHGILGRYFDDVAAILAAYPGSTYELFQIKEKFAALTIYADGSADIRPLLSEAYRRAREEAVRTCDVCGKPGRLLRHGGSWFMTRCDEHADGAVPAAWEGGKTGWPKT